MNLPLSQRVRLGPRPLPQHLALAALSSLGWPLGWPLWRNGSPGWKGVPAAPAEASRSPEAAADPALLQAIEAEGRRRLGAFLDGVAAYRSHPYRRTLSDPPLLWQSGTARLLDYGASGDGTGSDGRARTAVLVVPSLINRGYILDLSPACSLVRQLAAWGLRPLLVDWGSPGSEERGFTLTDYIAGRLAGALDAAVEASGGRVLLLGYCMGGLLALALAQLRPADVAGLALLATPWDFHAEAPEQARLAAAAIEALQPMLDAAGMLPVDHIQSMFAALDPTLVYRKFRGFAALDPASPRAEAFVAVEDWLNDGVPLAAGVARDCLLGWYGRNEPATGSWRVADQPIRPERFTLPSLVIVPAQDRIVPPASALALADALPAAERLRPALGHIGMIVASEAPARVWTPLRDWLVQAAT